MPEALKVAASAVDGDGMGTRSIALVNPVKNYSWGSCTLLAALRGEGPTSNPEAEVWMGAHSSAPSLLAVGDGPLRRLDDVLVASPAMLGDQVVGEYGRLPFLLKLLAAGEPLSLQAHPTLERAQLGFARENAAGVPTDAAIRSYKDENHKPELLCALTRFRALSGFLDPARSAAVLKSLDVDLLGWVVGRLESCRGASGLIEIVELLLTLEPSKASELALAVGEAVSEEGAHQAERAVARRIAETHPGDAGIVIALLLELVTLEPGQAIYLGAGRLHAYVDGLGVEIMAASDNVLRGGLTPKHVDVSELVATLTPGVDPIEVIQATPIANGEVEYRAPASEFVLSRIEVATNTATRRAATGPEIVVVTSGRVQIDGVSCSPTEARFVPAGAHWTISGNGQVFRARVGPSA